jgi:UPF0755 protein
MTRGLLALALWLKILLGSVLLLLLAGYAGYRYVEQWRTSTESITGTGVFVLERGQSFRAFAEELERAGLVRHARLWSLLARLDGTATRIKAGEYRIGPGDTPDGLVARLIAHDVVTYRVSLIEGWRIAEAMAALARDPVLRHALDGVDPAELLGVLGLPGEHPEGLFFPDTYQFERGDSDADILRRAHGRMAQVLAQAWAQRAEGLPYGSPYEALIVASLIEKETGHEAERKRIAQVFVNRLRLGMRLQTDPTVIYGLGDRFDGDLTRAHLREDTPYNTYVRSGLPPSPIALPGARSIEAALHPEPGDYLYFVSRGNGTSHFSTTLEEHNRAVREYQLR